MLRVRVRGRGGSSENSQALVMALRGFQRSLGTHVPLAKGESTLLPAFAPFDVVLDGKGCSAAALWREVWNLYDIAFDEFDAKLHAQIKAAESHDTSAAAPLALVYHQVAAADVVTSAPTATTSNTSIGDALTLVLDVATTTKACNINWAQLCAWLLGFAIDVIPHQQLSACAAIHIVGSGLPSQQSDLELMAAFVEMFWMQLAASRTNHCVSAPRVSFTSEVGDGASDSLYLCRGEGIQIVAGEGSPISDGLASKATVIVVPILSDEENDDDMQSRIENRVLNYCPCCGSLDPTSASHHTH